MLREGRHLKFDRKQQYDAKRGKEFQLVEMKIEVASLGEHVFPCRKPRVVHRKPRTSPLSLFREISGKIRVRKMLLA